MKKLGEAAGTCMSSREGVQSCVFSGVMPPLKCHVVRDSTQTLLDALFVIFEDGNAIQAVYL